MGEARPYSLPPRFVSPRPGVVANLGEGKEPADYFFSSAKYYERGVKYFAFLKDLRNEF
jgi:hypothetical protein